MDPAMNHKRYISLIFCLFPLNPVSVRRLIAWVDANCPYRGEEDIRAIPDPEFAGIEQLPISPKIATAPVIKRS